MHKRAGKSQNLVQWYKIIYRESSFQKIKFPVTDGNSSDFQLNTCK